MVMTNPCAQISGFSRPILITNHDDEMTPSHDLDFRLTISGGFISPSPSQSPASQMIYFPPPPPSHLLAR